MAAPRKPNVQNLLIGLGVILIIIAGIYYFQSRGQESEESLSPEEIIVQEDGTVRRNGDTQEPLSQEEIQQLKEEVDSVVSTAGDTTVLQDASGGNASGQAQRAFSDGRFYLKMTAANLLFLEKGFYYEGWLEQDNSFISIGRMELDNSSGVLYYTASVDRSDYNRVLLSQEPEDGDPAPAEVILEGEF
jgi:hypothetical protein